MFIMVICFACEGVWKVARPKKCRLVCALPGSQGLQPIGDCPRGDVYLDYDEYEVIRLVDYEGISQEECAVRMEVSRPTVTRMYDRARHKLADSLINGRRLLLRPVEVTVCSAPRPECAHSRHCCHKRQEAHCEKGRNER